MSTERDPASAEELRTREAGVGHADETAPTRALVIDLAVVQDQLRSLATRWSQAGPTPHGTALWDQLAAHEREVLRSLRGRRLPFRPVTAGTTPGGYGTW